MIESWPARTIKARRPLGGLPVQRAVDKIRPFGARRVQLCCALCGLAADWQVGDGVHACQSCGSQLFRARNPADSPL